MKSYHIWTTGCQMNKADSERLGSALDQMGLAPTKSKEEADVVVLNTCVVRQNAENKAVGTVTSLKPQKEANPEKVIAIMGCMVGPKTDSLKTRFPYVDVFMRPQQYDPLIDFLADKLKIDPEGCIGPLTAAPAIATFIPIIHGCDKFCSFCIIPYRRGREKSREISDVVHETEMLVSRGVREVTLLGQNVDSYGHDLPGKVNLADLLEAVNELDGIESYYLCSDTETEWRDDKHSSEEVINAKALELKTKWESEEYSRKRAAEYPSIAELTVALYDEDDKITIEAKRAAVKKKWPKDNSGPVE